MFSFSCVVLSRKIGQVLITIVLYTVIEQQWPSGNIAMSKDPPCCPRKCVTLILRKEKEAIPLACNINS
jgi:hypothetical protein